MSPRHKNEDLSEIDCLSPQPSPIVSSTDSEESLFPTLYSVIENPRRAFVQDHVKGFLAEMLVIFEDGEEKLLTFDIPIEDCSVQDLIDRADLNLSPTSTMIVTLVTESVDGINYIVELKNKETERFPDSDDDEMSGSLSPEIPIMCPKETDSPASPKNLYDSGLFREGYIPPISPGSSSASLENLPERGLFPEEYIPPISPGYVPPSPGDLFDDVFEGNWPRAPTYDPASPEDPYDQGLFERDSPLSSEDRFSREPTVRNLVEYIISPLSTGNSPASPDNSYDRGIFPKDSLVPVNTPVFPFKPEIDNGYDVTTRHVSLEVDTPVSPENPYDRGET